MPTDELSDFSAITPGSESGAFLRDIGQSLRGTQLRILTEDTPPSAAARLLVEQEFTELTGIEIEWIFEPLDQVFARTSVDTAQKSGFHDLFYIDQSWRGRFADGLEPLEPWLQRTDLAYPNWEYSDFLEPLRQHLGSFDSRIIAVPYDITIFICVYRRDILDNLGLHHPRTMDELLETGQLITKELAPETHGLTAQWRLGHYALQCNMTAWLWGHGGSVFYADGSPAINDGAAIEALEYMMSLAPNIPPAATTWDWHGESKSFARGEAAIFTSWGEYFPMFDDPARSMVAGLCEPAPMPAPKKLRPQNECGYGEAPGVSHQGGSGVCISGASKNKEAAWIFLQWLTSKDVSVRTSLLGGGASTTRESSFTDPRIIQRSKLVGPGTTRHFDVMRDAILNHMGTEPSHPKWAELSRDYFAVELGKMVTNQQSVKATCDAMAQAAERITKS